MSNENLNGTLVLVRPDLTIDPANGQGKVAVVNYHSRSANEVYVAFNNGVEAVYPPDFLLRMKDKHTIFDALKSHGSAMPLNVFKDLYKISTLLERNSNIARWQALEMAAKNPALWEKALQTMITKEKQQVDKSYSR